MRTQRAHVRLNADRESMMGSAPFPLRGNGARPPVKPEIIYLVAPGGNPNYGDEFILRAWLRHLARHRPHAEIVVDCHTPGQAAILLRGCHPRTTFVDTMWRVCFDTAHLPLAEAISLATGVVENPGRLPRLVSGLELLSSADTVHLVGGGYINGVWSHHLALLATATAAVRRSGGQAVATGQGLLPVGDADRLAMLRELQGHFALFDVRDDTSLQAIHGAGGRQSMTGDDAWLGVLDDGVYDTESPAAQREFVFCLQSDLMEDFADGRGIDGLTDAVRRLVADWQLRGEDVAVVEGMPGADRVVFDRVADLLAGAIFVPFTDVWNRGVPAQSGQTWVSTRFHLHLLAAAAGAGGLALSGRRDYYPTKHRSLLAAGSHWRLAEGLDLPATPVHAGGFTPQAVDELRSRKLALAASIYPASRSLGMRGAVSAFRARRRA